MSYGFKEVLYIQTTIPSLTKDRRDSNCSKIFFLPTGSYFLFIFETQSKIINEENDKKEAEESQ